MYSAIIPKVNKTNPEVKETNAIKEAVPCEPDAPFILSITTINP
jgi:hypothetical protein